AFAPSLSPETAELSPVAPPRPLVSINGYARLEERAKRRRVGKRMEAARAALACAKIADAAAAIDEIRELDPNLPELPALVAALNDARRAHAIRPGRVGASLTAAAVFGGIILAASSLQDSPWLMSYPTSAVAALVQSRHPVPLLA